MIIILYFEVVFKRVFFCCAAFNGNNRKARNRVVFILLSVVHIADCVFPDFGNGCGNFYLVNA